MGDVPSDTSEVFGTRLRATDAMRARATLMEEKASRLLKEALGWRQLAEMLEKIERHAASQSVDGSESGPHIGVGSAPENLLWKLASDYQEKF